MADKQETMKKKMADIHKLKTMEFNEKHKRTMTIVNLCSGLVTLGLFIGTLAILHIEEKSCSTSFLRFTLWLMLALHATNIVESACQVTGLEKLFCCCACVVCFFLYEVAVIVYMQIIIYNSSKCRDETPKQYGWLILNNIVYFAFIFITIFVQLKIWFSAPSEKDVEEELLKDEKEATKANTLH